jgi:hypothetical protein
MTFAPFRVGQARRSQIPYLRRGFDRRPSRMSVIPGSRVRPAPSRSTKLRRLAAALVQNHLGGRAAARRPIYRDGSDLQRRRAPGAGSSRSRAARCPGVRRSRRSTGDLQAHGRALPTGSRAAFTARSVGKPPQVASEIRWRAETGTDDFLGTTIAHKTPGCRGPGSEMGCRRKSQTCACSARDAVRASR